MFKKKSSVQISIEGNKNKCLEIPTVVIKYWKTILLSSIAAIILTIGIIVHLSAQKKARELDKKYAEVFQQLYEKSKSISTTQLENEKEISDVKKTLNKIDSTISIINKKMQKRGLKTLPLANSGGPVEEDNGDISLLSEYYTNLVLEVEKKLATTPLGRPHQGVITSRFGYRRNPFTNRGREMHSGIDFKGKIGEPVRVTADGKVTFAGYEGDYGYVVKVKHKNGYETRYAHLIRPLVKKNQKVEAGTPIGLLGNTGRSTGPHLHYEILKNNKKINPEKYLSF